MHRTFPSPCHTMSVLCCFGIWTRLRRMSCWKVSPTAGLPSACGPAKRVCDR